MSVTILAQTEAERQAFRLALQGHVPGLVELGDFSAAERLTLADTVQVVVIEHRVPDSDGLALVDWLQERRPRLPIVLVVQGGNTAFAVRAIRRGLSDYVPREHLEWLGPIVREWILAPWNLCRPHKLLEEWGLLLGPTIHELNNLFTPLQLGLDLLRTNLQAERREQLLGTMNQSVLRGADLIAQMLERQRLRREDCNWVSLDELVQRLVEERQMATRPMLLNSEGDLPPVWGDGVQLYHLVRLGLQLLQHLGEQRFANPTQSLLRIDLRQRSVTSPEQNPFGQTVRAWLELDIMLSQNERWKLAATPEMSPPATNPYQPGFDLLIMRGIVRRHHGRMDLADLSNEGVHLNITLPVIRPEEAESGRDSAG